ncbi:MAG TPA: ATP-binding protein [Anaerolineaceae bacterium]|nr:ATP-binding protein [Anaerolineaceae bacterium]HQH85324.1 ATP-binding protein [Anaerolineaceae bacterium]
MPEIKQPKTVAIITADLISGAFIEETLKADGFSVSRYNDLASAWQVLPAAPPDALIVCEKLPDGAALDFLPPLLRRQPALPTLLLAERESAALLRAALTAGVTDCLFKPLAADTLLTTLRGAMERSARLRDWGLLQARRTTDSLRARLDGLETLTRLGQAITSTLDIDGVLTAIVEAAVELTGAEEGSLLLLDSTTGELYMRAAKNFDQNFVRTFRLAISDTLAGSVLRSGQPVVLDDSTPTKIKTSYLVQRLAYVPLKLHGSIIGVLGVDNRTQKSLNREHTVKVLLALAEYAVIALENSRLYGEMETRRRELESILTGIQDGVMVFGADQRLIMLNPAARAVLKLGDENLAGRLASELILDNDLLHLVESAGQTLSNVTEFETDGRSWSVHVNTIPDVGVALLLHDITHLKKMDKIKSEFVHTVSHDLRSPLTAILGYVELIDRAGPVTDLQRSFIQRVQASVQNITKLVNDLVSLGQVEAGFDTQKELVYLDQIVAYVSEQFQKQLQAKEQNLQITLPDPCPPISANPVQIRQMFEHLLDNAIKYTPNAGRIAIHGEVEEDQIIVQVSDTGLGIPQLDLSYVFDKFYRGSNVTGDVHGVGLGLAIVRSIVENHGGRIWVESTPNQGSVFTVVLPLAQL